MLDYASLVNQSQMLAGLFWADLERHHPGIGSLNLPDDGRARVEAADPRAARRATPAELPRGAAGRAFVLPRPAAMVAGGPGPVGRVGRAVSDPRGRRPQLRQGDPAAPGPDAAAHPHPGPGASPTRRRRRGARPAVPTGPARRPRRRARRGVHRGAGRGIDAPGGTTATGGPPRCSSPPSTKRRPGAPFRRRTRGGQRLLDAPR